jgi:hypothetical protein
MAKLPAPLRALVHSVAACGLLAAASPGHALAASCPAERTAALLPADSALCASLEDVVRRPAALPLDDYEAKLGEYLGNFCHRRAEAGWTRDKRVRDTGPFTATLVDGTWQGQYHGTHAAVVVWYSPDMAEWLKTNRSLGGGAAPAEPEPVPAGAIMVKEMYPPPAAACEEVDPVHLLPTSGAAVMVRAPEASHDGWFWGWYGWSGWDPDWPPGPDNRYPYMGFGQYCVNCHASAKDHLTFASPRNIEGEPGEPLVSLSQHFFDAEPPPVHHRVVALPEDAPRLGEPHHAYDEAFTGAIKATSLPAPTWDTVERMPSQTYDNVWVDAAGEPTAANEFLTSDQCLGCHDAGGTGLQFDMTAPNPHGDDLLNLSPYATWHSSPMGLGGRDPIFFAQLASETETFHPEESELLQDICLGCHGVLGQRQYGIDRYRETQECKPYLRDYVDEVPNADPPTQRAKYAALARDGISCTACHHMVLGEEDEAMHRDQPQNACVDERQKLLNPDNTGFAKTFTGSFLVGPPDELNGPFEDPKRTPMDHALGIEPKHYEPVQSSELCGTCHTVHLPIMRRGEIIGRTYEQTTYPEWAFSDYRTGESPDGPLPHGAGSKARSCQDCHMPSKNEDGRPYRSKIAGIQEYSNFPEVENNLGPEAIDLEAREGFALHTLVGLNVFLVKMAQQFPDVLGNRTTDPMLSTKGLDPLVLTEQAMLDQASDETADIAVNDVAVEGDALSATVTVTSETGHKFPSGVQFRRAFVEFSVLDAKGEPIWSSGRTNGAGVIVDAAGEPIEGELWWEDDCSARLVPGGRPHQPHRTVIRRQDQAQIYQELAAAPPEEGEARCGHDAEPEGELTTSFLSICAEVKDNRILPHGFLPREERIEVAEALGAKEDLAEDVGPTAVGDDPDYRTGGSDALVYEVDLSEVEGRPAAVQATLYYQATPPFYLQDRFCTSNSDDTQRLYFLASHLNLTGTAAEDWKLEVVSTGPVPLTRRQGGGPPSRALPSNPASTGVQDAAIAPHGRRLPRP